jgi:putative endonuclease
VAEKMNGDCTLLPVESSFPRKRESILSPRRDSVIFLEKPQQDKYSFQGRCPFWDIGAGMEKSSFVYILASGLNGTLYVGVTSNLIKRIWEHREGVADGFSKQYGVKNLVWYEVHTEIMEAIRREKQIKKWDRRWKIELIQKSNPRWRDLYADIAT